MRAARSACGAVYFACEQVPSIVPMAALSASWPGCLLVRAYMLTASRWRSPPLPFSEMATDSAWRLPVANGSPEGVRPGQ